MPVKPTVEMFNTLLPSSEQLFKVTVLVPLFLLGMLFTMNIYGARFKSSERFVLYM